MRGVPRVLLLLAALTAAATALADERAGNLAFVLGRALYPVQLMAFCFLEVEGDPAFRDAADGWNERNGGLFATLEAEGETAGVDDAARASADAAALREIEATVSARADGAAYCHAIARLIEEGRFDIDRREDLEAPLKRIFGKE